MQTKSAHSRAKVQLMKHWDRMVLTNRFYIACSKSIRYIVIGKNKSNEMSVSTEIDNVGNVHNNKTIKYQATSSYFYEAWIQLQKIRSSHSRSHWIIHKILEKFFHLNEVSQFSLIFLQVSMSARRPMSSSRVVFQLRNKMAFFSSLTSFVTKPVQKSTHLNIYYHFRMVQLYVTNTKVCCFLPWTSNCLY